LKFRRSINIVNHPTAHRYQQGFDMRHDVGSFKRPNAARGKRKIDGSSRMPVGLSRVDAALVEINGRDMSSHDRRE
jgi:hypothetical protein